MPDKVNINKWNYDESLIGVSTTQNSVTWEGNIEPWQDGVLFWLVLQSDIPPEEWEYPIRLTMEVDLTTAINCGYNWPEGHYSKVIEWSQNGRKSEDWKKPKFDPMAIARNDSGKWKKGLDIPRKSFWEHWKDVRKKNPWWDWWKI